MHNGDNMEITLFTLKFDDNMIEAVMHGKKSFMKKEEMDLDEEADIQKMLFDNSKQHTKDLQNFRVENSVAVNIWNKLKKNGWR